jgi:hypothetical protein
MPDPDLEDTDPGLESQASLAATAGAELLRHEGATTPAIASITVAFALTHGSGYHVCGHPGAGANPAA